MNRLPDLTDAELHKTLLNALSLAASEYQETADNVANPRLAVQFAQQASDCRALASKLEEESTDA